MIRHPVSSLPVKAGFMVLIGVIFIILGNRMLLACHETSSIVGCPGTLIAIFGRILLFIGVFTLMFFFVSKFILSEQKKKYDVIDLHLSSKQR